MTIDPRSHTPVYVQLADLLRERIESGDLTPGSPLVSEARMTQEYGIGREAVRMAISMLRSEGLVTTVRGHGTRVRQLVERTRMELPPGGSVIARMPTGQERRDMDVDEGVPVLEVRSATSGTTVYPADRIELHRPEVD